MPESEPAVDFFDDPGKLVDGVDDEVRAALEQGFPGSLQFRLENLGFHGLQLILGGSNVIALWDCGKNLLDTQGQTKLPDGSCFNM